MCKTRRKNPIDMKILNFVLKFKLDTRASLELFLEHQLYVKSIIMCAIKSSSEYS